MVLADQELLEEWDQQNEWLNQIGNLYPHICNSYKRTIKLQPPPMPPPLLWGLLLRQQPHWLSPKYNIAHWTNLTCRNCRIMHIHHQEGCELAIPPIITVWLTNCQPPWCRSILLLNAFRWILNLSTSISFLQHPVTAHSKTADAK
jgi:hypothetical protein